VIPSEMESLVDRRIEEYAQEHCDPEPALLSELMSRTRSQIGHLEMLTGRLEGSLLRFLVSAIGARRVLEVGTFTGYSALMMASALPEDGELVTLEIEPAHAALAQEFFDRSPHGHKIRLVHGAALDSLERLSPPFDFGFVDADKENYPAYYEGVLGLLRDGGILAVDNVLWSGRVAEPRESHDASTRAIDEMNGIASRDPRVRRVMTTVRDGLFLIQKQPSDAG